MLQPVIKETPTITEYKELKDKMERLAKTCYENHKSAWECWNNGEPVKIWWDADGNLCIEYESGEWYHYNPKGEWW